MLAASRSKLVEEAAWENEINMGTGEEVQPHLYFRTEPSGSSDSPLTRQE